MVKLTPSAIDKFKRLLLEHPEEQVVRLSLKDVDDYKLAFGITLEEATQEDDEIQEVEGLTVGVEAQSAQRMDGMTLDYSETGGFKFLHPPDEEQLLLKPSSLN
jgi:Fe-S cluster assembly iron-binding protein IscA